MKQAEHQQVASLFHKIRELPPADRAAYLEAACAGNSELRSKLDRLLAADEQLSATHFLEGLALHDAAKLIPASAVALPASGTVIASYRLGHRVGAGGMGVVYLAEDLRLARRVALKILMQPSSPEGQEWIQRFQREARAAGQLNHPHIAAIFDAGFDHGVYYIAMEFVEGRTLRSVIASGANLLEVKEIVEIISQIASALSASHAAGIIHRDIKPENVMIRPDGFVKVLDFGLAAVRQTAGGRDEPELRTQLGRMAGTPHYISPEQVLGKPATPVSDLFSLGVLAYEVATGIRPFEGASDGAIFDAILHHNPAPPSAVRPSLGRDLDGLIMQALEKDPELRFQTASDLRSACRRVSRTSFTPSPIPHPPAGRRPRSSVVPWLAAGIASLVFGLAFWYFAPPRQTLTPALNLQVQQVTDSPGEENFPSFMRSGEQFVYASARGGKWDIYLQRVGGSTYVNLTNGSTGDNRQPAASPDGTKIAFRAERGGGGIFVMDSTGENPRRITTRGYLPAWSPDNRSLAYTTHSFTTPNQVPYPPSEMYVVDTETGAETKIPGVDGFQPNWSPHGSRIAYWSVLDGGRRDIYTVAADGRRPPVAVTADAALDWSPVWAPSGSQLWFLSNRGGTMNLWRTPIDERSGRTRGNLQPFPLPAHSVGNLAVSHDGNSFLFSEASQKYTLARIAFDPVRRVVTGTPDDVAKSRVVADFRFSPDGSHIAYDTLGESRENLWIMNSDGSGARSLTFGNSRNRSPEWSPDGSELAFFSDRGGDGYNDWLIRADGSGLRPLTRNANPGMQGGIFQPDGKKIIAWDMESLGLLDPKAVLPTQGLTGTPGRFLAKGCYCDTMTISSDGEAALCHLPGGEVVIYYPAQQRLEHTGAIGGTYAAWLPPQKDAQRSRPDFLFVRGGECFLYNRASHRETKLFSVAPNQIYVLNLSPDSHSIYFSQRTNESDLYFARAQ